MGGMMETLTADQAYQLATWYNSLARAIGDYRFDNWNKLSEEERTKLENKEYSVRNASTDFVELALRLTLTDLAGTLKRIKQATDQMKSAIKHLQNVGKAIKIATAAVTLGGAIVSMNPSAIAEAIGGAISAASGE